MMKVVRLRLLLVRSLLEKRQFANLHVVFLIRDPRGAMGSRWRASFCKTVECRSSKVYCNDLLDDINSARKLQREFPGRVHIIRYEDICLEPEAKIHTLFRALGIPYSDVTEQHLASHTNARTARRGRTFPGSRSRILGWVEEVAWDKIENIQRECDGTLQVGGYFPVKKRESITLSSVLGPMNNTL